jgi:hypothetical protein
VEVSGQLHAPAALLPGKEPLVKKFPAFYGTRGIITVFTGPYPVPDASSPHLPTLFAQDPLQTSLQTTVSISNIFQCGEYLMNYKEKQFLTP